MRFPMGNRAYLIVLEGIDGSGKSTQARRLAPEARGPGDKAGPLPGADAREVGPADQEDGPAAGSLTPEEELELFVRDRREDVARNLEPALAAGKIVVLDRYYFSTIAYQGAKGIDPGRIRRLNERFAIRPDLVFILDIEAGRGLSRIGDRGRKDELFEREDYLARVREIFNGFRGRKFVHIDGTRDITDDQRRDPRQGAETQRGQVLTFDISYRQQPGSSGLSCAQMSKVKT